MNEFAGYIQVHDWMTQQLHLSFAEAGVFALIYGFNDNGKPFNASQNYVASAIGATRKTAATHLDTLVEHGYLIKRNYRDNNGSDRCEYTVNMAAIAEYIPASADNTVTKPDSKKDKRKPASPSPEDEAAARRMIELYDQSGFPPVELLTDSAMKAIVKTVSQLGEDTVAKALRKAATLPKLHGGTTINPNIDWFLSGKYAAENLARVLNGAYDGQVKRPAGISTEHNCGQRQLDEDEIAAIHRMMAQEDEEGEQW